MNSELERTQTRRLLGDENRKSKIRNLKLTNTTVSCIITLSFDLPAYIYETSVELCSGEGVSVSELLVMLIIVHCQCFPRKVSSIMTDLFLD